MNIKFHNRQFNYIVHINVYQFKLRIKVVNPLIQLNIFRQLLPGSA